MATFWPRYQVPLKTVMIDAIALRETLEDV